jgi:NADH dehydrogenase/NADH:ubiquinone oxidoreductase subunit G
VATEVGTYIHQLVNSELSGNHLHSFLLIVVGNVIDLCPVGALTNKEYNFTKEDKKKVAVQEEKKKSKKKSVKSTPAM